MPSMKDLQSLMRQLEDQLVSCMRCGMCQAVCPLYAETGRETDVARGKLALLDGLLKEMFEDAEGVYDRLNKCLLCGSCAANCPSGVNVLDIFMKARAILTGYMGLSPAKKVIFRGMLSHPELFDGLTELGAKFQKIFTKPVNKIVGTSCARFEAPLLKDRHIKDLAAVPFHKTIPEMDTAAGKSGLKAAFFVGCLIDKIFPDIATAAVDVFNHHGVGVYIPPSQGCCGIPAVSSGDSVTFRRLVSHNLAKFEQSSFDYLVTSCATCTSTIKKVWPALLEKTGRDHLFERAKKLSEKTMDISQFLVSKVGVAPSEPRVDAQRTRITFHDPCHLKKSLGVFKEPRALINANGDYILREMTESDWCCGLGGSFNLNYYEISSGIGNRKRENIVDADVSVVATGCPACMLQISDALSKAGDRIAIKHPVEIYAEAIRKA